jgi:hypothetical protein
MSLPTQQEDEESWEADPRHYTGGRWRYVVLKSGQTVFSKHSEVFVIKGQFTRPKAQIKVLGVIMDSGLR